MKNVDEPLLRSNDITASAAATADPATRERIRQLIDSQPCAFAPSGLLACAPRPDSLLTQFGSQPHSGKACMVVGLPGGLVQPASNKATASVEHARSLSCI